MTNDRRARLWVSCLLVLWSAHGFAQSDAVAPPGPPPAHLSLIEGRVFVDREGRSDSAVANLPLLDGDRVRTEDGRAEVILPDGSLLHLDRDTTVDLLATDLLRLLSGRVYVIARGARDPQRAVRYQLDAPVASVQTGGPGEFRVWAAESARGREVELAVYRGQATIASSYGAEELRAGERSVVRDGLAPSTPQYFNSARWDEFDRWSATRRDQLLGTTSAQYLPSELAVYSSTFDQYGSWRSDPVEGAVWYPSVAVDWRPYSVGYWRSYPAWNSFWIAGDPWGWPTHHYGYWGFSFGFGWYWKPARVWGPSWVHWAYSPGYVSWCPLGRYGYPVFGHFGVRGHHYGNHVDPWRGWTVVPRGHYGSPVPMHRVAVDGRRLDAGARGGFASHREAPVQGRAVERPMAVARAIPRAPSSGGMAVPRVAGAGTSTGPRGDTAALPRSAAVPRESGSRTQADGATRPSPREAARVLAGVTDQPPGTATRRVLPPAPAGGRAAPRTEAPESTPDVTAFGSRRDGQPSASRAQRRPATGAQFGDGSPAQFGNGSPAQFGNGAPAQFGDGSPAQFGTRAPSRFGGPSGSRAYPRAPAPTPDTTDVPVRYAPRSRGAAAPTGGDSPAAGGGWSPPPAVRQNPYIRGGDSRAGAGGSEPRAYPRASEPPASAPRSSAPRSADAPRQYAPRDNPKPGGGMPSAPTARPRGGSSSAPASAPRYNPGSGASQPRGGGSSPQPSRRRAPNPD
jgi:hypothetical protein